MERKTIPAFSHLIHREVRNADNQSTADRAWPGVAGIRGWTDDVESERIGQSTAVVERLVGHFGRQRAEVGRFHHGERWKPNIA